MSAKHWKCAAAILVVALAACSNGSGSLGETPPTSPGQVAPPPTPTPTPTPTTPEPTPTPPTPPPTTPPPPTPPPPTPTPPPPATPFVGYWFGTVEPKSGRSLGGRAIIAANGETQLIASEGSGLTGTPVFVVHGNICCETDVDVDLKSIRYLSDRSSDARLEAKLKNAALVGKVKVRGDDYDFSLQRLARYDESMTLADLSGTYTRTVTFFIGPSSTYTVTLDPSGHLSGSHTNGCIYSGTASLPDAPHNLVKLAIEITNCPRSITGSGSMNGTYSGLGLLIRDTAAPSDPSQRADVFFHSLVGQTWLGSQPVER